MEDLIDDDSAMSMVKARGLAGLDRSSPEGQAAAMLMERFTDIAKEGVPEPVVREAAERMVAAVLLRRRLEDTIVKIGEPPSGPSKIDAARRAAFNSSINAWKNVQGVFNDALRLIRTPEKRRAMVPLADLLQAMGENMPITEVEYEVQD